MLIPPNFGQFFHHLLMFRVLVVDFESSFFSKKLLTILKTFAIWDHSSQPRTLQHGDLILQRN